MADDGGSKIPDFKFTWIIENFSYCLPWMKLKSPTFTVDTMEGTEWHLLLSFKVDLDPIYITFEICREDDGRPTVIDTEFELSFLDRNGFPVVKQWNKSLFGPKDILGFSKFFELKDVLIRTDNDFLEEGTLTVCCRMWRIATEIRGTSTCLGRSRLGMEHMSHQWIIQEFKTLNLGVEKTLLIQTTSKQVPSLSLSLFLDGGQIQIEITQGDECASNMCYCKISLIDVEKKVPFSTQDQHWFYSNKKRKDVWRFPIFLTKTNLWLIKHYIYQMIP
ncbi:MATH domain-containing protein [Caerostris extrusa]|uniref:MATH domain-containing protein n=1 Tax=Caerostris extrusa TaxID=172846 RepID=A0AAV4UKX5_CAEEX|nr:MATH domain-containing protein [Caerostris extrusa]